MSDQNPNPTTLEPTTGSSSSEQLQTEKEAKEKQLIALNARLATLEEDSVTWKKVVDDYIALKVEVDVIRYRMGEKVLEKDKRQW